MSIADVLVPEYDMEMEATRNLLERVPEADGRWRPHPKSYTLGDLAVHITRLPLWGRYVFAQTELDLGLPENASIARAEFSTTADLLERFDRHVAEGRGSLAKAADAVTAAIGEHASGRSDIGELQKAIAFVKKYPGYNISVEGHTDNVGKDKYNQSLSERRAAAVKKYLVENGAANADKIKPVGYGKTRPVADNKTAEGKFKNRRVEILILSE